jgi:hypothetical protein
MTPQCSTCRVSLRLTQLNAFVNCTLSCWPIWKRNCSVILLCDRAVNQKISRHSKHARNKLNVIWAVKIRFRQNFTKALASILLVTPKIELEIRPKKSKAAIQALPKSMPLLTNHVLSHPAPAKLVFRFASCMTRSRGWMRLLKTKERYNFLPPSIRWGDWRWYNGKCYNPDFEQNRKML